MSVSVVVGDADYYAILGLAKPSLSRTYELRELRQAYRKRALALHPDKNKNDPQAPARFNRLTVAFEFLANEDKRKAYDEQIVQHERHREKARTMDAEKKRLAEELRRREAAHASAQRLQSDAQFVKSAFKSQTTSHAQAEKAKQQLKREADLHRDLLLKREQEAKKRRAATDDAAANISLDHFFILRLHWDRNENSLRNTAESTLRLFLQDFQPFRVVSVNADSGSAQVHFYDQTKALQAAMVFTVLDEDSAAFKRSGLPRDFFFSARVIKKPRVQSVIQANVTDIDEEEMESMLQERMEKDLKAKETTLLHLVSDEDETQDDLSVTTLPKSTASAKPTFQKSLLSRLRITPRSTPDPSPASIPASEPAPTAARHEHETSQDMESKTLNLLRMAAVAKRAKMST